MPETSWDEVGQRFAELGRQFQQAWQKGETDEKARDELKDASERVKVALDDMADTINRAANSPGVHDAARKATSGVAEALATTLNQVADWIERPRSR